MGDLANLGTKICLVCICVPGQVVLNSLGSMIHAVDSGITSVLWIDAIGWYHKNWPYTVWLLRWHWDYHAITLEPVVKQSWKIQANVIKSMTKCQWFGLFEKIWIFNARFWIWRLVRHPGVGSLFPPQHLPCPPMLPLQRLLPLTSKLIELNLRFFGQRKYSSGEIYWMAYPWPWPKVMVMALINKSFLACAIKWWPFTQIITKLASYISLVVLITWKNFYWKLLWGDFFRNCGCVFSRWNWGIVYPTDVKRK